MNLERGEGLGRVDEGKSGVLIQSCTWNWELLKRRKMLKRRGADAGVAVSDVQTVEKAPTWSSPGRSTHSQLVPYVHCSQCHHLGEKKKSPAHCRLYETKKKNQKNIPVILLLGKLGFFPQLHMKFSLFIEERD